MNMPCGEKQPLVNTRMNFQGFQFPTKDAIVQTWFAASVEQCHRIIEPCTDYSDLLVVVTW